jgi:class 3 adenylate cyclase/tetratricopeptide (TPR) repeat protein
VNAQATKEISDWLEKLGMAEYAQRFAENKIDLSALRYLTDQDLKDIGVALGDRRKMLAAIAEHVGAIQAPPQPALTEWKPQDAAERRQVTVMFSDLVGSTALSARMDPEDLREVISSYQKAVAESVQRFGGFVAKYMGDGVLIYFGYPQAHEDDAERAVRAALDLIQAVGGLKYSAPLQTRVGIATGLVVVGDLVGTGEAQERGIVGETPNLAARLQGIAEPSTVVIAASTRKLIGDLFELQDLGAKHLKGITEPVRVWSAVRKSSVESRFEALRTATTPLVGREEEIELLMRRWAQAKAGEGCVVLISGEPGIGKSRLTETVQERLGAEPYTRLRFFCSPHHQDSVLYPAITQVERAAGFRREDPREERLDKLETLLARATNHVSDAAALIADLLSIPAGDRYPTLELTPYKRKQKTLAALVAQVEGLSGKEPVLMVFEDVHWSDPTTRELLDLLIDRVPRLPVLLVITFRPEFAPPWVGRPNVTVITLSRLKPRQRAEMIGHLMWGKTLPKEITDQIINRTDGVPLFIEELTKSVVESGLLVEAGDHYAVTRPTGPLAIPTTLHASLLARLDRLAPTREVAQIGSALGRSFSHELIAAVAQMPQQKLDEALEQLVQAELIFRRGSPPDAEYTFKHALVQDAAYDTLLRSRKQQLHARIATTLENQFPETAAAEPAILAHHNTEAGFRDNALNYLVKAGQQAVARSAMVEAVALLEKGLGLLTTMPSSREYQKQELQLRLALAGALIGTKGYSSPQVSETWARAGALGELIGETSHFVPIAGQWAHHLVRAEHRQGLAFAERMQQRGEEQQDSVAVLLGRFYEGISRLSLGEFNPAHALFEQCHELREASLRQAVSHILSEDSYSVMLGYSSINLAYLGYLDQARTRADEGVLEARRLRHFYTLGFCLTLKCWTSYIANMMREVGQYADEISDLANEHGFPLWSVSAMFYRGLWLIADGQASEGVTLMIRAQDQLSTMGHVLFSPYQLTCIAEGYGKLGQPAEGLRKLRDAEQLIETSDERHHEAEVNRLQGDLLRMVDDHPAAERSYHRALAVANRQNARTHELRAATSMARLWRDQGKRSEARDVLVPVYGWFTEGFNTLYLKEANKLLEELSS